MNNLELQLKKLGLPEKESKVLFLLLNSGPLPPSAIAKQLNLNRTSSYDLLNSLGLKGLVTKIIKRGRFVFQITPPKYWTQYWHKQENKINEQKEILKQITPDLETIYKKARHLPKVIFYEGIDSLEQAFSDSLEAIDKEIIGYSSVTQVLKHFPVKFLAYYTNEKIKREIRSRFVLKDPEESPQLLKNYKKEYYKNDRTGKFAPQYRLHEKGKYEINNEIMIYDNKVVIANITPPHFSTVLIQDKDIAASQRAIFEIAWNVSKPI